MSAPKKAPRIEPMPPVTITTSVRMRMGSPMPGCTETMGPAMRPARPASAAPSAKTTEFEPAHVHAQGRNHVGVGGAGADEHAHARAVDDDVQARAHRQAHGDDGEAVGG
jgi:hypothetical protein